MSFLFAAFSYANKDYHYEDILQKKTNNGFRFIATVTDSQRPSRCLPNLM